MASRGRSLVATSFCIPSGTSLAATTLTWSSLCEHTGSDQRGRSMCHSFTLSMVQDIWDCNGLTELFVKKWAKQVSSLNYWQKMKVSPSRCKLNRNPTLSAFTPPSSLPVSYCFITVIKSMCSWSQPQAVLNLMITKWVDARSSGKKIYIGTIWHCGDRRCAARETSAPHAICCRKYFWSLFCLTLLENKLGCTRMEKQSHESADLQHVQLRPKKCSTSCKNTQ